MAEPIKCALLLDYESLHRVMAGGERNADTRLADRAQAWLAAIESGRLIGPEGTRRRLLVKRCYAGPSVRGRQRDALASAGFEVIDCAGGDGTRSPVDMHMAMDTVDALGKPNAPDEFILLTGGAELHPLLIRLKSARRSTVIYSGPATAESDKALASALLDGVAFAAFLASEEEPAARTAPGSASDRAEIEAFARKIHAATNIPLFSPKTFAELFRHLTEEIREHGYHFQMTAKNVADRMTENGRNVTRRQVVFIVKGLALKGHVFSTDDTAERLAEVFRDQAQYLITNAGITLDEKQDRLLSAWFMSRPSVEKIPQKKAAASKAPSAPGRPAKEMAPPPKPAPEARPAPETESGPEPEADLPMDAFGEVEPEMEAEAPKPKPAPAPERTRQPAPQPPAAARAPQPAPVAKAAEAPKAEPQKANVRPPQQQRPPKPDAREEARAVIAARIAASARLKPGKNAPAPKAPPPRPAPKPQPPVQAKPSPAVPTPRGSPPASNGRTDALEDSILAAIAEAVDVLVEDGASEEAQAEAAARRKAASANSRTPAPAPEPEPESPAGEDEESGDIGDQIQRIIASYNRNRTDE